KVAPSNSSSQPVQTPPGILDQQPEGSELLEQPKYLQSSPPENEVFHWPSVTGSARDRPVIARSNDIHPYVNPDQQASFRPSITTPTTITSSNPYDHPVGLEGLNPQSSQQAPPDNGNPGLLLPPPIIPALIIPKQWELYMPTNQISA